MIYRHREKYMPEMRKFYNKLLKETKTFAPYTPRLSKATFGDNRRIKYHILDKGKIVAHMFIYKTNKRLYGIGVAVDKDYRGKAYAKKLIQFAEKVVKLKGGKYIEGTIYKDNWESVRLFTRHNYKIRENNNKLYAKKEL